MIEEPHRWIEAVANRREYIEDQLRRGSPIVLLDYADGLLLLTVSRETRKVFEVYDRIGFAALGHPADIERMRLASIDLAHVEGFNRSADDVSLRRLANYGLSPALKGAFEQIFSAPHIVKMLLVELGTEPEEDFIVKLDYDGSMARSEIDSKEHFEVLAGIPSAEAAMIRYLTEHNGNPRRTLEEALRLAVRTWAVGMETALESQGDDSDKTDPDKIDTAKVLREQLKSKHIEAAVLDRTRPLTSRFRLLEEKELRPSLKDV